MKRAWHLNNYQSGFHARSVLLKSDIAKMIMESFPGKKGYSDPVLDVCIPTFAFSHPVETRNLSKYRSPDEISYGTTEKLIPYRWFSEGWDWNKIYNLCKSSNCLRWNFSIDFKYELNEKIHGEKFEHFWNLSVIPELKLGYWRLHFTWASLETSFLEKIGVALESILKGAGLSSWVALKESDSYEKWTVDIFPHSSDLLPDQPDIGVNVRTSKLPFSPVNPNEYIKNSDLKRGMMIFNVSLEVVNRIARSVLDSMKPVNDGIRELQFRPPEADMLPFREWAEPRFGGPWVQEICGWAVRTPSPDDIDDSLPDWTLLPVAHFKILGSWRIVTVVKEPGGWRFHVTGKYTKDPLKHRHIRDELARKAGMTSETLWEPQEVGQGWLGVPG